MSASAQLDGGVTGDAELIASARSGDAASVGALYERHAGAAWVVARQYTDSPADADDVVADSFVAVFGALERGNGPEVAFRAYLFTVVRRVAGARRDKARRVQPTDDLAVLEAGTALAGTAEEPALAGFERGVVARAFHSLPERWQAVLWHTEVEGLTPAEIAPILGLTANGVAALAYRAREGLRQAYLQQHLQDPLDEGCRTVAGKLGAYVRGGLGTRETAQVEAHLEDCGTCRGLLLELGDVNHGMRAVIAPLVLGLAGLGALGVLLPVGGGIAAGAAAAGASGGAGAGGSGAGSAGAGSAGGGGASAAGGGAGAATGAGGAAAGAGGGATGVATGAVGAVGAGAAGGTAAAGGVAAFLASIPLGAAAIAVGGVAVAAAAAVGIATLLSPSDGGNAVAPTPSSSVSATTDAPTPSATPGTLPTDLPTPQPTDLPTDLPTPEPTDLLADGPTVDDVPADGTTTDTVTGGSTLFASTNDPAPPTEPTDPTVPTDPVVPEPPAPADVSVSLPAGGLALEAGVTGQALTVTVANSGGTAVTDLTAQVTLPDGVTLDGVAPVAFAGQAAGRFAAVGSAGWVCVMGAQVTLAECTLDVLPPQSTSTLALRVSVDESYEASDGQIRLHVLGTGIDYVAPPIRIAIAASPARLTLRSDPGTVPLVSARTRQLDLPVANVGGTTVPAGVGAVDLFLPHGVTGRAAPGSAWTCDGTWPLTCRTGEVAARTDAPLSVLLTADAPDAIADRTFVAQLSPSGRRSSETVTVPFTVQRPAALAVRGDGAASVALGTTTMVPLSVANTGDLAARDVQVTLRRPETLRFAAPAVSTGTWSCPAGDGPTVVCTAALIDPGAALDLPVRLLAAEGAFGDVGTVTVSAAAPDADPAQPLPVAVRATSPVLRLADADPDVLLSDDGSGTAGFTLEVGAADAARTTATLTLPVNLTVDPYGVAPQTPGCASGSRTVTCELGTVAAGSSVQVLVNVRWKGSAQGDATVVVDALGASATATQRVRTSSAGLGPRDRFPHADVTEVGAPLLSCATTDKTCAAALTTGNKDNNGFSMVPLDEAPPAPKTPRGTVPVSSTAHVNVPAGRQVLFAGLYWSANRASADAWSGPLTTARLRGPNGTYGDVTGEVVAQPTDNEGRRYYQSFADVTTQVRSAGPGDWSVADVAVSATAKDSIRTYYAGWSLVVVYSDPGSDASVTVYDGGQWIGTSTAPRAFQFAAEAGTTARIGVVAWEGDRTGTGDRLLLGDACRGGTVSRPLVPTRWDGSAGSDSNAFDSTATGWRAQNSLGTDAKAFREVRLSCDVSSLTPTTAGDQYLIGAITLRTTPATPVGTS